MPDKQKVKKYSSAYIDKKIHVSHGFQTVGRGCYFATALNLKSKMLTKITAITNSEVYQKDKKPPKTGGFLLYQQLS